MCGGSGGARLLAAAPSSGRGVAGGVCVCAGGGPCVGGVCVPAGVRMVVGRYLSPSLRVSREQASGGLFIHVRV